MRQLRRWRNEIRRRWMIFRWKLGIRCPLCNYLEGHSGECPLRTADDLRTEIEYLRKQLILYDKISRNANERAHLWEGKYRIVKHENNVLRRKLRRQAESEGGRDE